MVYLAEKMLLSVLFLIHFFFVLIFTQWKARNHDFFPVYYLFCLKKSAVSIIPDWKNKFWYFPQQDFCIKMIWFKLFLLIFWHPSMSQENLTLLDPGFLRYCPPLVSQLWDHKNSKTQFSQTDMVLSFHLSSWSASWVA